MCWLFCSSFPVRTEGASSGLAHGAQAVTGWPFLPSCAGTESCSVSSTPVLLCLWTRGTGAITNSACALSGQAVWLKPFIKDRH